MSNVKIQGNVSGTGSLTIAAPNTNTDRTLTLPDESGTVLTSASPVVAQKGVPAFSAYRNSNQTVSNNTSTKVQLTTEEFDTASAFDTSNYRFTPQVAGYYQFNFGIYANSSATSITLIYSELYKNGASLPVSLATSGSYTYVPSYPAYDGKSGGSVLLYLNGSTDYVELYGRINGGGTVNFGQAILQGFFVRAA